MKKTNAILLLILFLFIYSCDGSSTEPETKELLNTLWKLESFETDGKIVIPPIDQDYSIHYDTDKKFGGMSDCNEIFGSYNIESKYMSLDSLFTTKMGCGETSMGSIYFQALIEVKSYKVYKNVLTIYYGNDSKLFFIGELL